MEDVFQKVKKGDKMGMKNYAKKMHKQIDELVVKVLDACCYFSVFVNAFIKQESLFHVI